MVGVGRKKTRTDSLVRACKLVGRMAKARPQVHQSEIMYYQMLTDYFSRLSNAEEEGKFISANTLLFPNEILWAMDIFPLHTEAAVWLTALFIGEYDELISSGQQLGLAPEICSPHRGLAGGFATGALPRPNVMLWSNLLCDNTAKCGELLMEINQCPGFFLDHPYRYTDDERKYLVHQLEELILFLEEQSGHKMNWDRLSEIVAEMDKQIELLREIAELRKAVPSPFHPLGFLDLVTLDYLFAGQPQETRYLETLRDELRQAVSAGVGAVEKERFRLMSFFTPPMYLMGFLEQMCQERGVVSVIEPFFTRWHEGRLDPNKPLESVGLKLRIRPEARMYGPLDDRSLRDVVKSAEEYKVDGAVYYASVGCRHCCATVKLFRDTLGEMDIPTLTLDCDVVDPTVVSNEEVREKFERFFELLEAR
jgi:benzoyl-CoA reductase/2-hydroxyglutaryl-CoA dehydratase subunit BcrC/BadD/HgdB